MTIIEEQAYEAVRTIARQTARIADAMEQMLEILKLKPPESGCGREAGNNRLTGAGTPEKVGANTASMAAPLATFPDPDRQADVGLPQAVT
jgi:hypothetical protein